MANLLRRNAYLGLGAGNTVTGTTLSSSPVFDLTRFTGALAIVNVAVTATGNYLCAQVCTASGGTFNDLAGSQSTCHTTQVALEVVRPAGGPFIKFQLRQGTSGQHGPIHVFGVNSRDYASASHNSTLLTYKLVNAPGTGTATSS